MKIFAIDPGPILSAWVNYQDGRVVAADKCKNEDLLEWMRSAPLVRDPEINIAIEMIQSFGMAVGAEVFETCVWIGRFIESCEPIHVNRIYRKQVKQHLCGSLKAKDPQIRQALLDRFGPGRELAIGTKKNPGPLYCISGDMWSALAVAVTLEDHLNLMGKSLKEISRGSEQKDH